MEKRGQPVVVRCWFSHWECAVMRKTSTSSRQRFCCWQNKLQLVLQKLCWDNRELSQIQIITADSNSTHFMESWRCTEDAPNVHKREKHETGKSRTRLQCVTCETASKSSSLGGGQSSETEPGGGRTEKHRHHRGEKETVSKLTPPASLLTAVWSFVLHLASVDPFFSLYYYNRYKQLKHWGNKII